MPCDTQPLGLIVTEQKYIFGCCVAPSACSELLTTSCPTMEERSLPLGLVMSADGYIPMNRKGSRAGYCYHSIPKRLRWRYSSLYFNLHTMSAVCGKNTDAHHTQNTHTHTHTHGIKKIPPGMYNTGEVKMKNIGVFFHPVSCSRISHVRYLITTALSHAF